GTGAPRLERTGRPRHARPNALVERRPRERATADEQLSQRLGKAVDHAGPGRTIERTRVQADRPGIRGRLLAPRVTRLVGECEPHRHAQAVAAPRVPSPEPPEAAAGRARGPRPAG